MIDYLFQRLLSDAKYMLDLSQNEGKIGHTVVKGRLREILVNSILIPWLPPGMKCGTGIIIDNENKISEAGQDDVIIYDEMLCPRIAQIAELPDGVYLYNSVICRIEVKSNLTKQDVRNFIIKSNEIAKLKFTVREGYVSDKYGAFNILFAYNSTCSTIDSEYKRLLEVFSEIGILNNSGLVSVICIPGIGLLKLTKTTDGIKWQKLDKEIPEEQIAYFIACLSNSCFDGRMIRQNRDIDKSLEGGIGMYLDSPFTSI